MANEILLLIDHKENRRILGEWLGQHYAIIIPDGSDEIPSFDLAIIDGTALDRLQQTVHDLKAKEHPRFLPILFMTSRQDVNLVTRHLWQSVDELILTPIEKLELLARVEILVRARRLSLELHETNAQLTDRIDQHVEDQMALQTASQMAESAIARLTRLQHITAGLSSALTGDEVARIIVNEGKTSLEAAAGCLALVDSKAEVQILHTTCEEFSPYMDFLLSSKGPLSPQKREHEALWVESNDVWRQHYPGQPAPKGKSWLSVPLRFGGVHAGALAFAFDDVQLFSEEIKSFVYNLAQLSASALERARLFESERQARGQAEEANRMKMNFLAMISHELRTPLTSIKGFSSTLLADDVTIDPEMERSFVTIIEEETDKMTDLVEQLLDLSRLQAGMLSIRMRPQLFDSVIDECQNQLDTLTKNHQLQLEIEDKLPSVRIDQQRIGQVLVNLVGNAAKFSPQGSTITLTARVRGNQLLVSVRDQGTGIPAEFRSKVFEAFLQLDHRAINGGQLRPGAGLGLAICKGIIETHGGDIWVEDPAPQTHGAYICFTLPVFSPPESEVTRGQQSALPADS